jgi:hypothetical protein
MRPLRDVHPEHVETAHGENFYSTMTTLTHELSLMKVKINASGGNLVGCELEDKICAFSRVGPAGALDLKLLYISLLLHSVDTRFTRTTLPEGLGSQMGVASTPAAATAAGASSGQTVTSPATAAPNAEVVQRGKDKQTNSKNLQKVFAAMETVAKTMSGMVPHVQSAEDKEESKKRKRERNDQL